MDMPWYGWLIAAVVGWMHAAATGYAWGRVQSYEAMLAQQAKAIQIPGLPPNMPGPGGR